jgi:hypothetical protein
MKPGWRMGRSPRPPVDDWRRARPRAIESALTHALARPDSGWRVLDGSRRIGAPPRAFVVDGQHLIAWRPDGGGPGSAVLVAPESCPHLGASLAGASVRGGAVVCPWHGLELGRAGHGAWRCLRAHDDGVLVWVRTGADDVPPPTLPRPALFVAGVIRLEARCRVTDVIANRLDPWHGAHLHPYSFAALEVIEQSDELLRIYVEKRIAGPLRVAVEATFHCPSPHAIVMTITAGEGVGSLVETHATAIDDERTAIVETTIATSPRDGFRFARHLAPLLQPLIERSARRLWRDDLIYAERLAELRSRGASAVQRAGQQPAGLPSR